ncbi:dicarboxylate/amino acid:cation symporter [Vibrio chagasii]|nr:dicarboxylate/amino acid:cation symporter [Vibrio chagasii]
MELRLPASCLRAWRFRTPVAVLTNGNLLAIVVFSFMLGIALTFFIARKHPIFEVLNGLNKSINTIVGWIIRLARSQFSPLFSILPFVVK